MPIPYALAAFPCSFSVVKTWLILSKTLPSPFFNTSIELITEGENTI